MDREIVFSSDYIELIDKNYDSLIFTPVYSEKKGLYLYKEDDKPIKDILLFNSRIIINYLDGQMRLLDNFIINAELEDTYFKKRMNRSIVGTLFNYSANDAQLYDLDKEYSLEYKNVKNVGSRIKKRSL